MEMLLPCPFCGGTSALRVLDQNEADFLGAEDENYSENPYYQVVCCMTENSPVPLADWQPGCGSAGGFQKTKEQAIAAWNRRPEPENKPLTCDGCEHDGSYENEREYGYPSPCTKCRRIATDNYRTKPERSEG